MKLFICILIITVLSGAIIPCLSIDAQPLNSPHENPATAEYTADPVWLLLFHGDILSMLAGSNYEEARKLLEEFDYASIPEELRYVTSRYRDISYQLLTALDTLDTLLVEAVDLLGKYQLTEVEQKLKDAGEVLDNTQILIVDVQQASSTLAQKFGVFGVSPADEIRQARDRLLEIVKQLGNLINQLDNARGSLSTRYESHANEEWITTRVTLDSAEKEPFIGESMILRYHTGT